MHGPSESVTTQADILSGTLCIPLLCPHVLQGTRTTSRPTIAQPYFRASSGEVRLGLGISPRSRRWRSKRLASSKILFIRSLYRSAPDLWFATLVPLSQYVLKRGRNRPLAESDGMELVFQLCQFLFLNRLEMVFVRIAFNSPASARANLLQ